MHRNHVNYKCIVTAEPVAVVCSMTNTNGGNVSQGLGAAVTKESLSGQRSEDFSIKDDETPCFVWEIRLLFQDLKILVKYYWWNCGLTYWVILLKRCFLIDFVFCLLVFWPLWGPHCSQGQAFPDVFSDLQGQSIYHFPFAPEQFQYLMPSAAY